MSSKSAKLKKHGTVVRISQQYNQPWRGFTLQKGHIYGEDEKGYFVSAARPSGEYFILIHRCAIVGGDYRWRLDRELINSPTAQKILEAAAGRDGVVEYEPVERQIRRFYNPRLTTGKYKPMPRMRMPGGSWGGHKTHFINGQEVVA